jgi:hypothetical protein
MSEIPEIQPTDETPEIEGGEAGELTILEPKDQAILWEQVAANAEKMFEAKKKIWRLILNIAKPGDWMVFASKEKRKASIGYAGALRIASMIGISFVDWSKEKETGRDDKGEWYRYDMECTAVLGNRKVRVYGRAGSRDKFFGTVGGEFKELYQINEGDVRMAAWHNSQKEGVRALLGLHAIPPEELEAAGVKLENASSYAFKSKDEKAEATKVVTIKVGAMSSKDGKSAKGAWTKYLIKAVTGEWYSTFSKSITDTAKAAQEMGLNVVINYNISDFGNEIISLTTEAQNGTANS